MPATVDDLRCHWRRCPSAGPYADDKSLYEHLVRQHRSSASAATGNFICLWEGCPTPRSTAGTNRARHLLSHTSYRPFVCRQAGCVGKAYRRRTALVHHHLSEHHDMGEDEDDTDSSSSESSSSSEDGDPGSSDKSDDSDAASDSSQLTEDEDQDTARVECLWADCAASFSADYAGAAELSAHLLSSSHYPAQRCRWGVCRTSLRRGAFKSHVLTHLPEWYRPFVCDMCERSFSRTSALKHHQSVTHCSSLGKRGDREESGHEESPRKKLRSLRGGTRTDSSSVRGSTIAVDKRPTAADEHRATACAESEGPITAATTAEAEAHPTGDSEALLEQRLLSAETKIQQLEIQVQELLRGKAAALAETSEDEQLLDPALFPYND